MRWAFVNLMFATAAALSLLASAAGPAQAQTPKTGGVLNFAVVASPPSYDCHAEITFGAVHPVAPHYSLLLKVDGARFPKLAGDLADRRGRRVLPRTASAAERQVAPRTSAF